MARSRPTEATDARRQQILDAAEVVLRRHGPSKTNVVDVARELGQTHASVYRYFGSKAELIDALVERWLRKVMDPLDRIVAGPGSAADRLRAWLRTLHEIKVRKVTAEPEHFASFHALAQGLDDVVARHLAALVGQVAAIIAAGVAAAEFRADDPARAALAVINATMRFHHPAMLAASQPMPTAEELDAVIDLLLAGLRAGPGPTARPVG